MCFSLTKRRVRNHKFLLALSIALAISAAIWLLLCLKLAISGVCTFMLMVTLPPLGISGMMFKGLLPAKASSGPFSPTTPNLPGASLPPSAKKPPNELPPLPKAPANPPLPPPPNIPLKIPLNPPPILHQQASYSQPTPNASPHPPVTTPAKSKTLLPKSCTAQLGTGGS